MDMLQWMGRKQGAAALETDLVIARLDKALARQARGFNRGGPSR